MTSVGRSSIGLLAPEGTKLWLNNHNLQQLWTHFSPFTCCSFVPIRLPLASTSCSPLQPQLNSETATTTLTARSGSRPNICFPSGTKISFSFQPHSLPMPSLCFYLGILPNVHFDPFSYSDLICPHIFSVSKVMILSSSFLILPQFFSFL